MKERVSVTWVSLSPLFLVHPLMVSPFLLPSNVLHIMHTKEDGKGITQQVTLFMEWLRRATGKPQ